MSAKEKPRLAGASGTAQNKTQHDDYTQKTDPLTGWHSLAKAARERQMKKSWSRKGGRQ